MNELKACFFDLDDTLINYEGASKKAWYLVCVELVKVELIKDIDPLILLNQINFRKKEVYGDEEKSKEQGKIQ